MGGIGINTTTCCGIRYETKRFFCEFARYMNRGLTKHIQITPLTAASPATAARKDSGAVKQHRDNA
jgi:hypothetical protein